MAKELGIARETVRKYLTESIPIREERQPRRRPVWARVRERVETLLAESVQWTGGKQRLTATRLHELLVAEGHAVGVTLVKEAVAEWKRQRREVFVPLTYRPGDLAEVARPSIRWPNARNCLELLESVGGCSYDPANCYTGSTRKARSRLRSNKR